MKGLLLLLNIEMDGLHYKKYAEIKTLPQEQPEKKEEKEETPKGEDVKDEEKEERSRPLKLREILQMR
ncbi:hypothetical protein [Bacillus cereus]|nr:hypothetical protein [Bacillus cereus]